MTFIDSSVLLAAWRGISNLRIKSLTILSDSNREFTSSPFVKLELLPKAIFHKNLAEVEFYQAFFESVINLPKDLEKIISLAEKTAGNYGLNGMDALHISAAILSKSTEFITAERPTSPLFRVKELNVISIR